MAEEQAKGELTPQSIEFQPRQKVQGNNDEFDVVIFPATPNTKPFPDDFHKKIAAQSYSMSVRDCDTRMRQPALRAMALNSFPVAIFYSSCWVKSEALKAHAGQKKFEATSYFITSYKRSFLYVSRGWKTNEMGNSANDLSDADKAALGKKEDELMDFPIFDIKLCDTSKPSDACATLASTVQKK